VSTKESRILSQPDANRRDEAAKWFSAQRRGAMSFEERTQFDAWRADGQNQTALDSMHELWGELSGLKGVPAPAVQRRRTFPLALAASLVIAVAGAALLFSSGLFFRPSVRTAVGEQRVTTLPDGSVVNLNVATRLEYRVGADRRDVTLADGEALFFVHKDTSRPFTVRAGDYEVRALGTAFNVRERDSALQIAVLEGSVSVQPLAGSHSGAELVRLTAGQKVSLPEGARGDAERQAYLHPPAVEQVPVQEMAEWRLRTVTYEDASIAEIVADLNRFFPRRLEVSDPNLARRRVTLRLQVADRERTLQTLSALLGVRIRNDRDADAITDAT
jgi:transmembrane sensor